MRYFIVTCIMSLFLVTSGKSQEKSGAPESKPVQERAGLPNNASVKVYQLRYSKASEVFKTIQDVGPPGKIAVDERINALLVLASKESHEQIANLIETIDTQEKNDDSTELFVVDERESEASGPIVSRFAELAGVKIAYDEEMGIFLIKGPKEKVERTKNVIDQINQVAGKKIHGKSQTNVYSCSMRVFWLTNDPVVDARNTMELGEELKSTIQKLGSLGYPNMQVKMQLIGRCDLIQGKSHCRVEGANAEGNSRRSLEFSADLKGADTDVIVGKLSVNSSVSDASSPQAAPSKNRVEVDVSIVPNKLYVLSASPVGGFQSAYVVQLVKD